MTYIFWFISSIVLICSCQKPQNWACIINEHFCIVIITPASCSTELFEIRYRLRYRLSDDFPQSLHENAGGKSLKLATW